MTAMALNLLLISVGAALGACLRWGLGLAALQWQTAWPLGTLAANWIGAYCIGLAASYFAAHAALPPAIKLLVATGFLGGLTTFSTFSYETVTLFSSGNYITGILNTCLNLFLSFGGVALGKYIGTKCI